MSVSWNCVKYAGLPIIATAEALSHQLSQRNLDMFSKSLTINAVASIIRAIFISASLTKFSSKMQEKKHPLLSMGVWVCVIGSSTLFQQLNPQKSLFQIASGWLSLLSFTTHLALTARSKSPLTMVMRAALDAYSFYRTSQQSWIRVEKEFIQQGVLFKCVYEAPSIAACPSIECLFCGESSEQLAVADRYPGCIKCARQFFETQLDSFRLVNLTTSITTCYAQKELLPFCPETKNILKPSFFSLHVWNDLKGKFQEIYIQWISYQVDQKIHVTVSGLSSEGLFGHLSDGTQVNFPQSFDQAKIGQPVCGKVIKKTVESQFLFLTCSISEK